MNRRWLLALVIIVSIALPTFPAMAGTLTAGQYTYILKGRNLELPVDPISIQNTFLMPEELFRTLNVGVEKQGNTVRLTKGPVVLDMIIGDEVLRLNDDPVLLKLPPMEVSGRLFIPIEVAPSLGTEILVDGRFVLLKDYEPPAEDQPTPLDADAFMSALAQFTVEGVLRNTNGGYGDLRVTVLTAQLLHDKHLQLSWGDRVKLLSRVTHRDLLLVTVKNTSARAIALDPGYLYITTANGKQADYLHEELPIDGRVTEPIAPGASRTSILVFTKTSGTKTIYDGASDALLGQVAAP